MSAGNDEQVDYWNGPAGRTWVDVQERLDAMLAPITAVLLARAEPRAGERAVDVGCGCGDTTIALAKRGTAVWGIDISEPMLAHARARAAGLQQLAFSRTDAATQAFTPDHQLVLSRFGVMFFAEPSAAFANLRSALTADGRLVFSAWQAPALNPWVAVAGRAVQPFLPEPDHAPDPRAPGPFAFADADYLRGILEGAGYTDIELEPFTTRLQMAEDLDSAMDFLGAVGPLARVLKELDADARAPALDAVRAALSPHIDADGLRLGAACWLVRARPDRR
jgi:SAM-dependent methyltransferase